MLNMITRHYKLAPFLGAVLGCLAFTGCISDKGAKDFGREFGLAFSAPIYGLNALAAADLVYCSESFRKKTDHWPTDYAELSEFVRQSNGYLWLGTYERVDLARLEGDVLQINFVPQGSTNEMKLRLGGGRK
jgi:hypothetical protein